MKSIIPCSIFIYIIKEDIINPSDSLGAYFIPIKCEKQYKYVQASFILQKYCSNNAIASVEAARLLYSGLVKYQKSTANLPFGVRKFAISVGFDYQLEWMVMHNGADLTKLRPGGIRSVCSPCKGSEGRMIIPSPPKGACTIRADKNSLLDYMPQNSRALRISGLGG